MGSPYRNGGERADQPPKRVISKRNVDCSQADTNVGGRGPICIVENLESRLELFMLSSKPTVSLFSNRRVIEFQRRAPQRTIKI